jgi:hypothetical protein
MVLDRAVLMGRTLLASGITVPIIRALTDDDGVGNYSI